MFKLVVVGTIVAFASAHSQQGHPVHHGIVNDIKQHATTWTPMEVEENPLRKLTVEQIMGLLGTNVREPQGYRTTSAPLTDVPDTFDARVQWPNWIHPIRDQAQCGSCWAFGATEALSDRFTIQSYGSVDVILSPQDLVSCDSTDYGCNGGYLDHAWIYLTNTGAVSDGCFPYQSQTGSVPQCLSGACTDSHVPFTKYKCVENTMIECTTPDTIKAEIFANGPMETGFDVYEDFFSYQSGVY